MHSDQTGPASQASFRGQDGCTHLSVTSGYQQGVAECAFVVEFFSAVQDRFHHRFVNEKPGRIFLLDKSGIQADTPVRPLPYSLAVFTKEKTHLGHFETERGVSQDAHAPGRFISEHAGGNVHRNPVNIQLVQVLEQFCLIAFHRSAQARAEYGVNHNASFWQNRKIAFFRNFFEGARTVFFQRLKIGGTIVA